MKKLFLAFAAILFLSASARATEITVSSFQPGLNWNYGSTQTITLRVYVSQSFVTSTGVSIVASPVGGPGFYKTITCSLNGTTLTVNSFTLHSTTDANPNTVRYTFIFYQGSTKRDTLWSNYQWPTAFGATISNAQLESYNRAAPAPPRPGFLTSDQIQQLINAVLPAAKSTTTVNGIGKISVNPADAVNPIFVGDNDPRLGKIFNIMATPYNAVCDGTTADTSAISAAVTAAALVNGSIYLPPTLNGCKVGSVTISVPIVSDGGSLVGTSGVTTTITSSIIAPPNISLFRNFNGIAGHGTASFSGNSSTAMLYPQWWGARGNDSTESGPAITATMTAASVARSRVGFLGGTYRFASPPNLGVTGVTVQALGAVVLKHTGTGPILNIGPTGSGIYNASVLGDFTAVGNASSDSAGVVIEGILHGRIEMKGGGAPGAMFTVKAAIKSSFELTASPESLSGGVWPSGLTPTNGVVVTSGTLGRSTNSRFAIIAESVSAIGLNPLAADSCTFTGTSESNGTGILDAVGCQYNTFNEVYLDGNSVIDIDVSGVGSVFNNVFSKSLVTPGVNIEATGKNTSFNGGFLRSVNGTAGITPKFTNVRTSDTGGLGILAVDAIWDSTCARVDSGGNVTSYYSDYAAPTLLNSWVNFGSGFSVAGYQKSDGIVRLKGLIRNGTTTAATVLFTLPSGYRPATTLQLATEANSVIAVLEITSAGDVKIANVSSNAYLSLSGITFVAGQ